ncbi:MAG: chemotaxis protein CheW [Methylophilaceae bacterium]
MAEKVKLRDYQKSILDRLEDVRTGAANTSANYLGVEISGRNVLVELLDISETLVVADIEPIPLVNPWFLGMTNVRGVLYAINDLAHLLDHKHTEVSSSTRMLLINDTICSNVGFLADRLIGLRSLDVLNKRDESAPESICFKQDVYEDDEKKVWYVLDCERLISSKEFETPYAA